MKFAVVCLLAVIAVVHVSAQPAKDGEYTHKYDNIDVDQILHNDRLLNRYADCVLERNKGRCPPEAIELRKVLGEALETECAKCSEHQREMTKKVIRFLVENKRDVWTALKAKYDPDGKFAQRYEGNGEERRRADMSEGKREVENTLPRYCDAMLMALPSFCWRIDAIEM
ncbi:ObirCsp3.2 [Ooceraea biroi]|uniref:ObirCsp3.2 n=1 Tax=Ooceraea biroi TaxID=2015173 RepID=A0A3L8DA45_OOCBI|nr:ejaculatory bulb-specific protein 3-like [Ooceraea biroi]RLU17357.1 ObirCsp3.2 [Ooceraea biroi]